MRRSWDKNLHLVLGLRHENLHFVQFVFKIILGLVKVAGFSRCIEIQGDIYEGVEFLEIYHASVLYLLDVNFFHEKSRELMI